MIDTCRINVTGGKGGNGSVSFRRERFVPRGGPDGGKGGDGGAVVLRGDDGKHDFSQLGGNRRFLGGRGQNGGIRNRRGKDGESRVIAVPLGTVAWEIVGSQKKWVAEIVSAGKEHRVAGGGEGGWGNTRFASSINKSPLLAEEGTEGEARSYFLELRLLADAAVVGQPNAGKSLLLQRISRARPTVADYPFTTIRPERAVVEHGWGGFTVLELPGVVSSASAGKGLGVGFLRHLWRPRLQIMLIDGTAEDPLAQIQEVNREIEAYDAEFVERGQVIVVNKIDTPEAQAQLPGLKRRLAGVGLARHFISALTGEGVEELVSHLQKLLQQAPPIEQVPREAFTVVPKRRSRRAVVSRIDGVFVVSSREAERLVRVPDLRVFRVRLQLRRELARLGVVRALEEAGVEPGDRVRIGVVELPWE